MPEDPTGCGGWVAVVMVVLTFLIQEWRVYRQRKNDLEDRAAARSELSTKVDKIQEAVGANGSSGTGSFKVPPQG